MTSLHQSFVSGCLLGLFLFLSCTACGQTNAAEPLDPAPFNAERAWADLKFMVDLGPRRMGTPNLAKTRTYIREQLEPLGWVFEEVSFPVEVPEGAQRKGEVTGTNLLARRAGTAEGEIWLCSHYDTYGLPGFVGANDAGSSSAILIELGRQLAGTTPYDGCSLVLCWFDGEEPFYDLPWDDYTNSTFGSRYQVQKLKEENKIKDLKALILLDLVGDKDLGVSIDKVSAMWLSNIFQRTAQGLDYKHIFVQSRAMKDDHLPFYRAGVSVINLIDFNYGPNNEYWHTREDKLENCSQESLQIMGTLVMTALPMIDTAAQSRKRP